MEKIKLIDLTTHRYVAKLNKGELVNGCKNCVFFDEDCEGNCAMNAPNTVITKDEKRALFAHCIGENRYYKCVSCADDDIVIEGKKYYLIKYPDIFDKYTCNSCRGCDFLNNGRCKVCDYKRQNKIDKIIYEKCKNKKDNYIWIEADKVDLVKPQDIEKGTIIKFDKADMEEVKDKDADSPSSTGVVNPNTDDTPKEPNTNTKRHIDVVLTLDEARNWYYSLNPILKDLAVRAFTPAELEDVRKCTMDIGIKTAKRLYRNAEKAVRDFVLSAFTEEELKD